MFVESFGRALKAVVGFGHGGVPGREVPEQSPGSNVLFTGRVFAVQMQAACEVLVHAAHQTIQHVAGAMAFRMIERLRPSLFLSAQVQNFILHWSFELLFAHRVNTAIR